MLDYLQEQSEQINHQLEEILPRAVTEEWVNSVLGESTYAVDKEMLTAAICEPVWDFLDRGGKRWRPSLLLTSCGAIAGNEDAARPLVPLIEFIHNGTLVHDDLEDNSTLRRGKLCLHKQYGVDIATNVGSAMYFIPLVILYGKRAPYTDEQRLFMYDLVVQELVRCHCGQAIDIAWHNGGKEGIAEEEYLQMCAYKTGVLARLAARLGAYIGGGTAEQVHELGRFGESIGVAFQIQDDILNLVGERFAEGKGRGEDIHEGKRTLLVLHALEKASERDAAILRDILATHPEQQSVIDDAIEIIARTGAIDYARQKAVAIVEASWGAVDSLLSESPSKQRLRAFADFVVERDL
jgi:geranylgeranyl pyrophosphate synthase